jgi:hypothetical protein
MTKLLLLRLGRDNFTIYKPPRYILTISKHFPEETKVLLIQMMMNVMPLIEKFFNVLHCRKT